MLYNITKQENKNFFLFKYDEINSTLNKCFDIIPDIDINSIINYSNSDDKFTNTIYYLSLFLNNKADNIIENIILSGNNKRKIKNEFLDNLILNKINEIFEYYNNTLKKKNKIKFTKKNKEIKKIVIFLDRFGYFDGKIKSSIDIASTYNITRERVRQITNSFFNFIYFYDINKFYNKKNKITQKQEQSKEYFLSKISNYKILCDLIPILYYFFIYLVINKNNEYKEEQNKIFSIYNPEIDINANNIYYNSISNIIKNILNFSSSLSTETETEIETNNKKGKKIKFIINFVFYYMNYYFNQKGYIPKEINGIIIFKNEHIFCCEKNIYDDWINNWLTNNNNKKNKKIEKMLFLKNINALHEKERNKVEKVLLKYKKFFLKKINKINFFKKQQINNTKIIVLVLLKNNKFMTTKEIADYIIENKNIYKEYMDNNYKKYKNKKFCLLTFLKEIELIDNKLNNNNSNNNNNNNNNNLFKKQKNKIINKIKWIIYKVINNEITKVKMINKNYEKNKNKSKNNMPSLIKCKYIKKKENNIIYYKYNS